MDFSPPAWLRSPHVQTLGASLPWWSPPRAFVRSVVEERLSFAISGEPGCSLVARAWWQRDAERRPARTAILVHGVGGTSESTYVTRAAVALHRVGMNVVRLNLRGAGEGIASAPSLYHAGLTEDLRVTIDALVRDPRVHDVVVLGFSLGGNMTLKLAGEWGASPHARVAAVAAISPPLDLDRVCTALHRLRALPYRAYVLRRLVEQGREFARLHPSRTTYDVARLARLRSIRDYDEIVVAPMHGFSGAAGYYAAATSGPWLAKIEMPTLLVYAADDPMIPEETMRPWLGTASPAIELAWSDHGGHVGWFGAVREASFVETWAMRRVIDFFARR